MTITGFVKYINARQIKMRKHLFRKLTKEIA